MNEPKKIRPGSYEREAFMRLNLVGNLVGEIAEALENRSKYVKYGKRDLMLLKSLSARIMNEFIDTVPQQNIESLIRNIHSVGYTIGAKMPTAKAGNDHKNFGLWICFDDLNAILCGLKDKCMFCDLDAQHEASCPLRKALDNLGNEVEHTNGRCGYHDKFE